jgi:hypothetical protein
LTFSARSGFPEPLLIPLPQFAYGRYLQDFTDLKAKNEAKATFQNNLEWANLIKRNNAVSEIDLTAEVCFKFIEDNDATDSLLRAAIARIQILGQVKGVERLAIAALVDIAQTSKSRGIMGDVADAIMSVLDEGSDGVSVDRLVLGEVEKLGWSHPSEFASVMARLR